MLAVTGGAAADEYVVEDAKPKKEKRKWSEFLTKTLLLQESQANDFKTEDSLMNHTAQMVMQAQK